MIKLSRKVLISVFTLAVTILALGASTFAWFALSTTSQVSNIGGQVTAGEGIEVKLYYKGADDVVYQTPWKSNLSESDVTEFLTKIKKSFDFKAVTSADGATNFTKLGQDVNGKLKLDPEAAKNTDYLEFEIHFHSQADSTIALANYEFDATKNPIKAIPIGSSAYWQYNVDNVTGTEKSAYTVNTKAAYGARISFNDGTNTSVYQHPATTAGLTRVNKATEGNPADYQIEGNYVMETSAVEFGQWSYMKDSLGLKIYNTDDTEMTELPTVTLADAKTAVVGGDGDYYTKITLTKDADLAEDPIKLNFGKFTVRLWIEGWDADTYDVILDMRLFVTLEFKKLP